MKIKEAVERIIAACHTPPFTETCDQLICGDWERELTGIVTTFMATPEVIRGAIDHGANLIITHEPTFYTHLDPTGWLGEDEVLLRKKSLIDTGQINIWRFHDQAHRTTPDLIFSGLNRELGWAEYWMPAINKHFYQIPATNVRELAAFLKDRLQVKTAQIVGNIEARVERVGFLAGGGSLGLGSETMPMEFMKREDLDVIICGELLEWTLCAYVRDAAQLGLNKALIVLGHNRTEEAGMKYLPDWLREVLPGVPVSFIEAGEPFSYL